MSTETAGAFIFDIDGVLADSWHRRKHIRGKSPDWEAFFAACADDPALPLCALLGRLSSDFLIILVTSRPERNRNLTVEWLRAHGLPFDRLYMRPDDADHILWKVDVIRDMADRYRMELIFEDCPDIIVRLRQLSLPVVPILSGYYDWQVRA